MTDETRQSRRSVLRKSGLALATATAGLAATGTASASYFGQGQEVRLKYESPCWYYVDDNPCNATGYYMMPEGSEGQCTDDQQSFSCATYVPVDHIDFNLEAWLNVNLLDHANRINE